MSNTRFKRIRGLISAVVAATMTLSMLSIPAFAAPNASQATNLVASGNATASIVGTATAGLTGTVTGKVSGTTIATQAFVQSNVLYLTSASQLIKLSDLNVSSSADAALRIKIHTSAIDTDTVVPGLTTASTVADVVNAINTSFGTWVHAKFDDATRIRIQSNAVGASTIGVYDNFAATTAPLALGMADAVFRGTAAPADWEVTDGATAGLPYSADFGVSSVLGGSNTATFTPTNGTPFAVTATVGSLDTSGNFVAGVDGASGYYTAAQFTNTGLGLNAVVKITGGTPLALNVGTISFDLASGVRAPVAGTITVLQGDASNVDKQAGKVETLTISVPTTGTALNGGLQDAINAV
jgi:hypothetical protein